MAKTLVHGGLTRPGMRLTRSTQTRKALERGRRQGASRGDVRTAKRMMALLAVAAGDGSAQIAPRLPVSEESLRLWGQAFG
jgi:hypothetical protein